MPNSPKAYRLIVAEGEVLEDTLPDAGALAGFFRFNSDDMQDAYARWMEAGAVHHAATAPGHWLRELEDVAALLELEIVSV